MRVPLWKWMVMTPEERIAAWQRPGFVLDISDADPPRKQGTTQRDPAEEYPGEHADVDHRGYNRQ